MSEEIRPRDGKGSGTSIGYLTEMLIPVFDVDDIGRPQAETDRRTITGGPRGATVFVPATPQNHLDDPKCDMPGLHPVLRYASMLNNYNVVATWGYRFNANGEPTKADNELLAWLDGLAPEIERIRRLPRD